jgi:gluconate 2-dehydrogenase gamma chain
MTRKLPNLAPNRRPNGEYPSDSAVMRPPTVKGLSRRALLASTAAALIASTTAQARSVRGKLPWAANAGDPPRPVRPGAWVFFTPEEGSAIEAIVDRLIPPDPQFAGGKDAGCAVFIDGQLAGPYGSSEGLYMMPPFLDGTPQQGNQAPDTPAQQYRKGLAALDAQAKAANVGKSFRELSPDQQDTLLRGLESGQVQLHGINARKFFALVLTDTKEGFFADPVYGGNRNMVSWRMIGFPGARYDYSDWVLRHNERYPRPPVSIGGRADWTRKG